MHRVEVTVSYKTTLGGNDIFCHITSVERSGLNDLREGQRVRYDLENDRRTGKTKAINIELII